MATKSGSTSTLKRCIKAPMKALCKLRDLYVKSMTSCAGNHSSFYPSTLPKSFSGASSRASEEDEDLRELMRMASQRSQRHKVENSPVVVGYYSKEGLPKSFSVGIGRIDEDKPCYFEDDFKVKSDVVFYPRSRSYAVAKRRTGMY